MADERSVSRDLDTRKSRSWTELFRTFMIAADPFKLVIAAFGILFTAVGWWMISVVFFNSWTAPAPRESDVKERRDAYVKEGMEEPKAQMKAEAEFAVEFRRFSLIEGLAGPGGKYRTMPWFEDRGPNPFLLADDVVRKGGGDRQVAVNYFLTRQVPNLVEPLLKFLSPVFGLFNSDANFWVRAYLIALLVWLLVVWAFVGGVITRMAIVQIAGKEGGGVRDAIAFVKSRFLSYVCSPLVPLALIFAVVVGCMVFGLFHMIPLFGDIVVDGFFWWIPMAAGFVMALLVIGLVGYPLMYSTLSAEGSDTFDALSRSYNYVYESPWKYLWYSLVAIAYGAVLSFFVVLVASLMTYLGKWAVGSTPMPSGRQPDYLFVYAPTSFGWREVLLKGSPLELTDNINEAGPYGTTPMKAGNTAYYYRDSEQAKSYLKDYAWYNQAGAGMVSFWLTVFFMLMLGFGYSYFWTASSMIYLLMRKNVDETEFDEIYIESELPTPTPSVPPATPAVPPAPAPVSLPTVNVDPPTLKMPTPPPAPPAPEPPPAPPAPEPPAAPKSDVPKTD